MKNHRPQTNKVAFQGLNGAYSHAACQAVFPEMEPLPCAAFEDVFAAVNEGQADLAMIPIENSVAGRVADIHHLLPESGLHINAEYFHRVNHHLLAPQGATMASIKRVRSHVHALGQCRRLIRDHGYKALVVADTAGAAEEIARLNDPAEAAIASSLAGEIHGLQSLQANIEDAEHNTTRFVIMAPEPIVAEADSGTVVTTFVFRVRNVPAALYKALGGFATNGINMTKLESYQLNGDFVATQFYADVEGHPEDKALQWALEELDFFTNEVKIIGVYPAHAYRFAGRAEG